MKFVSSNDVNAVERHKLPQVLTDSHSEERQPHRRARMTYKKEREVSDDDEPGGQTERITPEVRASRSSPCEEGDTVRVRAGRSQQEEERTVRVGTAWRAQDRGQSSGRDKGRHRVSMMETEEDVVEVAAGQAVQKQVKKVRTPKVRRRIRMMLGHEGFDVLAEFQEIPVTGLKWGALLDMAPSLRWKVGTGFLQEQQPRKPKSQKEKPPAADALVVSARF